MNIFNDVIRGASTQFGREFGRAGANAILKGKNYYSVNSSSDYSGRIKPSDSFVIKAIKEINKIKFVTTDKANTSRLIELTDLASDQIIFKGVDTLNQISDIKQLINDYNDKFEHGSILVSDDFKDKSLDFLKEKRQEFINLLEKFNTDSKTHIKKNLELELRKKKSKKIAALLAIPCLGFQWAYLKSPGITVLSVLLCWTIIVPVINFIFLLKVLFMSQDKFDMEFNPVFSYYNQFK